MFSRLKKFGLRHEFVIVIVCIVALLRIPSLFEPYWYGDEGIYLTLGTGVRHGLELYRDIHDNKPPIVYLLAALAGNQFWYRMLLLLWNSFSIVFFWMLAHLWLDGPTTRKTTRVFGIEFPNPLMPSSLATVFFAFLPFFAEGMIPNGEIFFILPTVLGMLVLTKEYKKTSSSLKEKLVSASIAGFFFSFAFLIKVPAAFDAVAAGLFFFVLVPLKKIKKLEIMSVVKKSLQILAQGRAWMFVAFFLFPILATVVYYALIGAGEQYVRGAFAQNIGYLSSWQTGSHQATNVAESGLKNRAIGLALGMVVIVLAAFVVRPVLAFASLWFIFALFGALLSERPYPHYLIQVIPPLALLVVVFIGELKQWYSMKKYPVRTGVSLALGSLVIGAGIASLVMIKFWYYPLLPYYKNFAAFITKSQTKEQYFSYFDAGLPEMYTVAEKVVQLTMPFDPIFIWGDVPTLYALTNRVPPSRYTSAYHIQDFNGYNETMQSFEKHPPKLIVVDKRARYSFLALQQYIMLDYRKIFDGQYFTMYKRMPTAILYKTR